MKKLLITLSLLGFAWTVSDVESRVLQEVRQMMRETGGRVTFSDLHNSDRFGPQEKEFLARLYEIFFQLPGYLLQAHQASQPIPTRAEIARHFSISPTSVELLLRVMESDRRVPPLFEREPSGGEIARLDPANIQAFIEARGDQVRISQWEGKPLPGFDLETFDGGRLRASDLKGKNALIYFWFTGCPPCVRIAPILSELDRKYGPDELTIVGFNADRVLEIDIDETVRDDYLQKSRTEYVNAHLDSATREAFGNVNVFPMLFFVNPEGVIVQHLLNFQEKEKLEAVIQRMLSGER